jgi:hypothetical protein
MMNARIIYNYQHNNSFIDFDPSPPDTKDGIFNPQHILFSSNYDGIEQLLPGLSTDVVEKSIYNESPEVFDHRTP